MKKIIVLTILGAASVPRGMQPERTGCNQYAHNTGTDGVADGRADHRTDADPDARQRFRLFSVYTRYL